MKRTIIITVCITVWFIVTIILFTWACGMLTKPSTNANIVGIIAIVLYSLLSIKTKCFTSISLTNKKSKETTN